MRVALLGRLTFRKIVDAFERITKFRYAFRAVGNACDTGAIPFFIGGDISTSFS